MIRGNGVMPILLLFKVIEITFIPNLDCFYIFEPYIYVHHLILIYDKSEPRKAKTVVT